MSSLYTSPHTTVLRDPLLDRTTPVGAVSLRHFVPVQSFPVEEWSKPANLRYRIPGVTIRYHLSPLCAARDPPHRPPGLAEIPRQWWELV